MQKKANRPGSGPARESGLTRLLALPKRLLRNQVSWFRLQRRFSKLTTAQVFERTYAERQWGALEGAEIYSGYGSHGDLAGDYVALIAPEIARYGIRSLVDLGCGDFAVGARLADMVAEYTGIDIVQQVVEVNHRVHAGPDRRFIRADLTADALPSADGAVVRQVLQHLSNAEIHRALGNVLRTYPVVFVTEHVSTAPVSWPNLDMAHCPSTRAIWRSGVYIDRHPFWGEGESCGRYSLRLAAGIANLGGRSGSAGRPLSARQAVSRKPRARTGLRRGYVKLGA